MSDRPMKELDFVMVLKFPQFRTELNKFIFQGIVFEDKTQALLLPMPTALNLLNLKESMSFIETETAYVCIPYNPDPADDEYAYCFGVYLTFLGNDTPALAEMIILDQYKVQMWEQYRHLAEPFKWDGD